MFNLFPKDIREEYTSRMQREIVILNRGGMDIDSIVRMTKLNRLEVECFVIMDEIATGKLNID